MFLSEYCSSTSLHGWQYLTREGVLVKLYWAVVVLLSIAASLGFVVVNVNEFTKSTVVTVLDTPSEPLTGRY